MQNQDKNLVDLMKTLLVWRKFIFRVCGIVAVLAVVILLLLPDYFTSSTTFYAASQGLAVPETIYGRGTKTLEYYGEKEDIDRVLSVCKSSKVLNFLIDSFQLYDHYEIDRDHRFAAFNVAKELKGLYTVTRTKENAIEISIEDKDAEMAANMVNAARNKINEIGQQLIKESQAKILSTYKENLEQREQQLNELNDSLRVVRDLYGVYNTVSQGEVLSSLAVKAEAKLQAAGVKLAILESNPAAPKDTMAVVKATINALKKEVSSINDKLSLFNKGLAKAEVLGRTQRESTEQLSEDRERYKQFRSAYESDFPAILLLEPGVVPVKKSRPVRSLILIAVLLVTFIFCVIGILLYELYREIDWEDAPSGPITNAQKEA